MDIPRIRKAMLPPPTRPLLRAITILLAFVGILNDEEARRVFYQVLELASQE